MSATQDRCSGRYITRMTVPGLAAPPARMTSVAARPSSCRPPRCVVSPLGRHALLTHRHLADGPGRLVHPWLVAAAHAWFGSGMSGVSCDGRLPVLWWPFLVSMTPSVGTWRCSWFFPMTPSARITALAPLRPSFLQFDPAPRRGEPHANRRTPDYFL